MHIVAVLEKTGWRIAGQGGAAEVLGLIKNNSPGENEEIR